MKHCLLVITVATLLYMALPCAVAQETGSSDQAPAASQTGHRRAPMDPAKRAAMLAKRLNLKPDQRSKVEDILK